MYSQTRTHYLIWLTQDPHLLPRSYPPKWKVDPNDKREFFVVAIIVCSQQRLMYGMNMSDNTGSLNRFIQAQNALYDKIVRELKDGKKITHWMWYVFPQIAGLGHSATAMFYAIQDSSEAQRYLLHPILGERLLECTKIVLSLKNRTAREIFGDIDAMKFRSSMTLFMSLAGSDSVYRRAIDKYFDGEPDQKTQDILSKLQR